MCNKVLHIYFSRHQLLYLGSVGIWKTPDGGEIEGTEASDRSPEARIDGHPSDLTYVGEAVGHMVRSRVTDPECYRLFLDSLQSARTWEEGIEKCQKGITSARMMMAGIRADVAIKSAAPPPGTN